MKVLQSIEDNLARMDLAHHDRLAVIDGHDGESGSWGRITYARLVELVRAQMAGLDHLDVPRGERVAVATRSSARLLASFLAVSGTGRVLLPIDVRTGAGDIAGVVEHSGATMLLVDPEFDGARVHSLAQRFVLGTERAEEQLYRPAGAAEPHVPADDAVAILEYPKNAEGAEPVTRTHRDLRLDLAAFGWQLNLSERDVYLHAAPLCHSRAWGLAYALAAMGGLQVGFDKIDAVDILRRIEAYDVTLIDDAPAVDVTVLGAAASWQGAIPGRDRVRVVLTGPPPSTMERVEAELGWAFVPVSGLTEPARVAVASEQSADELAPSAAGFAAGR